MRPEGGVVLRGGLDDGEGCDDLPAIGLNFRPQSIDARSFEPLCRPILQVPAAGLLQFDEQIVELGVPPGVLAEVFTHTGHELLLAYPGDELLEHGCTLGIGDAVEVDLHILQIVDRRDDRMRSG